MNMRRLRAAVVLGCARGISLGNSTTCRLIRSKLEAFYASQSAYFRSGESDAETLTYLAAGGLGDQSAGFLGAVSLAMLTGRVLRVPGAGFFYGAGGLEPAFAAGPVEPVDETVLGVPPDACSNRNLKWEAWTEQSHRVREDGTGVTNMYCAETPLLALWRFPLKLNKLFVAKHEFVRVGNVGDPLFRLWLDSVHLNANHPDNMPCAFRALLSVTDRVKRVAREIGKRRPPFLVGIHVRASRYHARNEYAEANDNVFGCDPPNFVAANFTDVWRAADALAPDSARDSAKWLVVTDSLSLKRSAERTWPHKVLATNLVPAHNEVARACGEPPVSRRKALWMRASKQPSTQEGIIAELYLLSRADVIVAGRSRFSTLAAFLCEPCSRFVYLSPCSKPACEPVPTEDIDRKFHGNSPYGLDRPVYYTGHGLDSYGAQTLFGTHVAIDKIDLDTAAHVPITF